MPLQFSEDVANETHGRKLAAKRETAKGISQGKAPAKNAPATRKAILNLCFFLRGRHAATVGAD
jgi:hypothetical protein